MTKEFTNLDAVKMLGKQYAIDSMHVNKMTTPQEGLFSGEWADGLTGQDVVDCIIAVPVPVFTQMPDEEQTEILDAFEAGYLSADWPEPREE